jgi:hypothetical protein
MRWLFALLSLTITGWSCVLDYDFPSLGSWMCRAGVCRYDQIFSAIDARGQDLGNMAILLNEDPSNPLVWCAYAEILSKNGQTQAAGAGFERAVALGAGMSPVLMRAANFDFTEGRLDHGLEMTHRILGQTEAFDQILFSYLARTRLPVATLAGATVPATPRAARAWFSWLSGSGSDQDLRELWSWMRQNKLLDEKSATDFAWAFWGRKAFATAQDSWAEWLGSSKGEYLHPQRIANVRFEDAPNRSPFDWKFTDAAGVNIQQNDGLDIRYSGTANVDVPNVRQFMTAHAGVYRFSAEIDATNISTDQGPFFHFFDPENPGRLSVESSPVKGTVARYWMTLDVHVPPGTQALQIQLERRPSHKFDNKIAGRLHIYQVSLLPIR